MKLTLRKHEEMLLALLRAALKENKAEEEYFQNCTEEDWERCNQLSIEQGVMCLAWDGILTLPAELMPPRKLKLKWSVAVAMYEKQYEHYCKTAEELTKLFAQHGIATTVLKGVGMSTLYPKPEHREGGDIDIYTYSADRSKMSDQEANALADQLMMQRGIDVNTSHNPKHSIMQYNGITIENHKAFLSIDKLKMASPINEILKHYSLNEPHDILNGSCHINIPDNEFNTIFIAFHTARHYSNGLSLHHLCDWACILLNYNLKIPNEITDPHFYYFVSIFTEFTNRFLGTEIKNKCSEKELQRLFIELFRNPFKGEFLSNNPIKIIIYKTRNLYHIAKNNKRLFGESISNEFVKSINRHLHNPKSILNTKNTNK